MQGLNIYGYFFGGFFAVTPLVFLLFYFKCVYRAMWSSAD